MIAAGSYIIRYRMYTQITKNRKNEPLKYHFTIAPYLCTQKNQSHYG